jgi:protein O-GlcNAc transferase
LFLRKAHAAAQGELWKCVLAGAPSRDSAWLLVQTYRELKNYADGFARLGRLPSEPSPSVDRIYLEGFLLFRTGKHRESIDVLGRGFRIDPQDWRIHHVFALNYVVLDISEGALHELQVAIQLNPQNAELYYQLARFFYSQSRVAESVEASEKAIALEPDYADVYTNLGLCYESLAEDSKARLNYEKAIEINRQLQRADEWPFINYASFLIKQEATERSLALLAEALEQNPHSGRAYYLRGKALRKLERLPEAKRELERSIALDAQDASPFYELGLVLRKLGDAAGSKRMFENFQELSSRQASKVR